MNFLRNLLAAILGFFIAIFILFILFMGIGALMSSGDEIEVKSNSVLELDFAMPVKDYAPKDDNPFAEAFQLDESKLGLDKVLNAIENAKNDDDIKGISIKSFMISAGMAQTQAIRNKLEDFKTSGKFIYAYNDFYTQKSYYLSSVADSLFLNPVGAIDFKGLSSEILYFKDFEDKYGIKMEVIRHGKYKSAVEPFLQNEMSEANREQTTSFLESIWSEMTDDMKQTRGVTVEKLDEIADNSLGRNAEIATQNNLIDAAIYEDEYKEKIKSSLDTDKLNLISLSDYIKSGKGKISSEAKDKIAVIYAQGDIQYGEGDENYIGQELINKSIRKAVKDDKIKAIVLRVNSPGGSALASELIWRELDLAKKEKPLVVSMGNLAASGGYYIACVADKIIAEPTTITGSIGVFGALPNGYEFASDIGINAEQVSTNDAASYSFFEPLSEKFYDVTKEGVEQVYETFVNRVASGRKMTFDQVHEVAQGRVWTGKEAVGKGLVDELGGLDKALSVAADLAEVEDYKIKNYPSYKKDFKDAFKGFPFAKVDKEAILKETLGAKHYTLYNNLTKMQKLEGIQARIPYVFEIK